MNFQRRIHRWGLTAAVVLVAFLIHIGLHPVLPVGALRLLPYIVGVAIVSRLVGPLPSVLVLVVGLVTEAAYLAHPDGPSSQAVFDAPTVLTAYVVVGVLVAYLSQRVRQLRRESRSARQELDRALAAADVGSWHFNFVTRKLRYSDNVGPLIGRPRGFVYPSISGWREDVHPDDWPAVRQAFLDTSPGQTYEVQCRTRTPAGDWRWMLLRGRPSHGPDGRPTMADGVVMDVTATRATELNLWRRSEELRTMLDLIPAGVAVAHDRLATEISASPALERLLGVTSGSNVSIAGGDRDALPYRCLRDGRELSDDELPMRVAARDGREVRELDLDLVYRDGRTVNLLVNAAPLFDADGKVRGAIGVHTDVTALKQAQRELERGDRQKDIFLATLAHELRNPLAPVRYAAAVLRPGADDKVIAEARRVIERQTAQMSQLLDELLDMSRITRDVIELRREKVDFARVVRQEVDALQPRLAELERCVSVEAAGPLWVEGDETRLHQVVSNLLSNAAKYTNPGGRIRLAVARSGDALSLSVRDDGVGIAAADLPHVFDLFAQVRRPGTPTRGGLGIGLAVVRRLVQLHGGQVEATSAGLGQGAEFTVRLPLAAAPSATVGRERRDRDSPTPGGVTRVLVVDDNHDAADTLAALLLAHGYEVRVVYGGQPALDAAESFRPAVILLDLGLPDLPGEDVARAVRAQPWGERTFIVAVTGWGQPQDRARTAAAGFDHHLVKPVDPAQLLDLLEPRRVADVPRVGEVGRTG